MKAKGMIILMLVALFVLFVIQNNETVTVWFLFWQITGSRAAVLVLTSVIGAVTGWLVGVQHKKRGPEAAVAPFSETAERYRQFPLML